MTGEVYEFAAFRFNPSTRELWRGDQRVELPRRTFECIEHLIAHRDRAVGRDELVEAIFGRSNVSDAQLGQVVLRARRALDDDGNAQRTIRTVAGYGYRWVADVRVAAAAPESAAETMPAVEPPEPTPAAVTIAEAPAHLPPPSSSRPRPRRRRVLAVASAVVLLATVAVSLTWLARRAPPADSPSPTAQPLQADSVVVLPLQVDGLRDDAWVRLGAMDLVAERLRQAGFRAPTSESVLALLKSEPESSAEPPNLRATTGAHLIVRGSAKRGASGWQIELAAAPEHGIAVPVRFTGRDAMQATRGAADLLLAALGRNMPSESERDRSLDETLQRARAAMLANELDTAREILTASPDLAASSAQLAYRLALVDFRAGQLDRAEASLDQILRQPEAEHDAHFRAQVLTARGAVHARRGEFADGGRDYDAAVALLTPEKDPLELGQALMGRANSRVPERRYDEALADYGAARTDLERAGDPLGIARVDANLGLLELFRSRPAAALGYLLPASDRFQSFGALHELLVSLTGIVQAQLAMLQRNEAAASVERGWALRERVTDPDQRVDLLLNQVEVQTGNGRLREAAAALAQARASTTSGNRVLQARLRALGANLAAAQGDWHEAADEAAAALTDWPPSGADEQRSGVVLVRQRALLALGDKARAETLLDRRRDPPEQPLDSAGVVTEALAMAEWEQQAGDAARARRWFRFAAVSADRRGVPAEIVLVAEAWAPVLLAAGDREQAAVVIGRVAPWATRDFDCALLQLRLFHALNQREPWFNALRQAQALAGERTIPAALLEPRTLDANSPLRLSDRAR
ncbi:winged helix-turn-helix domain-containing protein [Dokdonella sp.]|uniref:winged helix-turn-helix domain-containing protein n=1 Tax=Dokdonella sp. TaxID=2291710 RepID=UPI001B0EA784|nr:winged helix-turn-helix domain-containing protein [Dokdonella sp.]MBO9662077.1 tetratricopeptide repeat protein [Dokdonella sp.]